MGAYFPGRGFTRGSVFGDIHGNGPHRGADFPADAGTPIPVAADGVVVGRGFQTDYGYAVIVEHDAPETINIVLTMYAHMPNLDRTPENGTRVVKGQIIGVVGSTGYSTDNHLHLELISLDRAYVPWSVEDPWTGGRLGIAGSRGRIDPANAMNWSGLDVYDGEGAVIPAATTPSTSSTASTASMCFVGGPCSE